MGNLIAFPNQKKDTLKETPDTPQDPSYDFQQEMQQNEALRKKREEERKRKNDQVKREYRIPIKPSNGDKKP